MSLNVEALNEKSHLQSLRMQAGFNVNQTEVYKVELISDSVSIKRMGETQFSDFLSDILANLNGIRFFCG